MRTLPNSDLLSVPSASTRLLGLLLLLLQLSQPRFRWAGAVFLFPPCPSLANLQIPSLIILSHGRPSPDRTTRLPPVSFSLPPFSSSQPPAATTTFFVIPTFLPNKVAEKEESSCSPAITPIVAQPGCSTALARYINHIPYTVWPASRAPRCASCKVPPLPRWVRLRLIRAPRVELLTTVSRGHICSVRYQFARWTFIRSQHPVNNGRRQRKDYLFPTQGSVRDSMDRPWSRQWDDRCQHLHGLR